MSGALTQLAALGGGYRDPLRDIDWAAADPNRPWLPPQMLSLAGRDIQRDMSAEMLVRFSQVEFARLCAAGVWLEGLLISRVTSNGLLDTPPGEARVMLQEVREEAGHGLMFLEMIGRAGLSGVPLLGDTRFLTWVARRLKPDSAEFWAMVYIGESVTDNFALRALRADRGTICPVARQVLTLHHKDEARHIAAARALFKARVSAMSPLRRRALDRALRLLVPRFLRATLFPTTASLAALGLPDPAGAARAAATCPERRRLAEACAAPALRTLERALQAPRVSRRTKRTGSFRT